ncbi:MAG TPA: class I SAM-dependent methyltransferase [Candidatus Angelobacter sp.]|nr:class I SAM-dependent methyltransferase [Candidatus Angelobacter sp.]
MEGSPWRQPHLAKLTYGEMFHLINRLVLGNNLRILEVGCGRGYLSLELARKGHDVLGIDVNYDAIRIAYRTMKSDPYSSGRGKLEYEVSDFAIWNNMEGKFDLVIFNRALHHIPQPAKALEKARDLLGHNGRMICVEYAYDQFDRRSATWFYHIRSILEQAGWFNSDKKLSENLDFSIGQIREEWHEHGREENLNRFLDMYRPLKSFFEEQHLSWEPYIFWDIIMDMRIPSTDTEMAVARSLSAMERAMIEREAISPVLFCFSGEKSQGKF